MDLNDTAIEQAAQDEEAMVLDAYHRGFTAGTHQVRDDIQWYIIMTRANELRHQQAILDFSNSGAYAHELVKLLTELEDVLRNHE
jgi:hypothetical protein